MIASVILSDEILYKKNELRGKNVITQEESFVLLQEMLLQAVRFQQDRQANEAKRIYQLILQDLPTQPNANHNLGVIELEENNFDVCLVYLKRALESAPDEPQYWISYINALLQAGQFDDAGIVLAHGIEGGLQGEDVDSIKIRLANKHLFKKSFNLPQEVATTSSVSNTDESAVSQNLNNIIHGSVKHRSNLKSNNKKKLTITEMNKMTTLFNQGRFEECEQLAVLMTQHFPKNGIGWKVLGAIYQQQGLIEETFKTLEVAAELLPNDSEVHYNLGNCLYDQNKLSEAARSYQKAIKIDLGFSKAHYNLGSVLKDQGFTADAVTSYKKALKLDPNNALMHFNLAQMLHEQGLLSEALDCYQQGLKIQPDFAPAFLNLGVIFKAMGQMHEVEECYRKAIVLKPNYAEAYNNLSIYFLEKGNVAEAEAYSRRSIEINPDYADAYNNLGLILSSMSRFDEAEAAFLKALEYNPSGVQVLSNFSVTLKSQGQIARAESCLRKGIEINPDYLNLYTNLVTVLLDQGRIQEAIELSLHVLEIKPDCFKSRSNLLFAMNYSANQSADECLEQAIKFGNLVSEKVDVPFTTWPTDPNAKRLRVGMISGDFCQHAVAYFLENLVSHIDPSRIELIAYKTDGRDDEVTSRLKPYFSGWRSLVGIDDENAARLIHSDGLHILIDLSGHTAGNRLPVLAWKPAPVQVSWLGYFATTGMNAIDYFIADKTGVPKANVSHFVEKIKYLPDSRLCFTVPEVAIEVSTMPALTNGYITFGCFQNMAKVGDDVLKVWSEVMTALPNARLRWQCKSLGDTTIADDVMKRLIKCGIGQDRVALLGSISRNEYLAAHSEVDMILDTFPFTGGTTTCEALWMGVPTLTLNGDTLIARQGASILSAAGLTDFIAESKADFVSKALLIVGDLDKLAKLRAALRKQVVKTPIFDATSFAKNMENLLWGIWNDTQHIYGKKINTILTNSKEDIYQDTDTNINQSEKLNVEIISATRFSESDFWKKSALGLSLHRHLKQDVRISANIVFENTRGLSAIFNDCIDQAGEDDILVFIHDDVWIDESNFADAVLTGLEHFDVIGVAGNVRRLPNQPAWAFIDQRLTWDDKSNLSGRISHSKSAFGKVNDYGALPAECELLDGVFLAAKKSSLMKKDVRFDSQFHFHFYDLDFCRSARLSGLRLGTWPVKLTHQSPGAFGSVHWLDGYQCYLNKWEAQSTNNTITHSKVEASHSQELQQAVKEVLQMAFEHQNAGRIEQAEHLYLEVINIQPTNAEANHSLGVIYANSKGALAALSWLEIAVQTKPQNEQFWVSYIDALMQSGATDTAVDALRVGQQYGLRAETSQMLAAEFVKELEAEAEKQKENYIAVQSSVMEAMKVVMTPSVKCQATQHKHQTNTVPVFYIWAPNYTEYSSGIKALHLLCDRLIGLGHEAYVTTAGINKSLRTPQATTELINTHKLEGRFQIAIYPEVQMGNPILVPNVVRYLLNKPNFFLKTSWFGSFHEDECLLHYDDTFAIPWLKSEKVSIQIVDRTLFRAPSKQDNCRSGFLVYSHRVSPDLECIPDWCKPFQVISMINPRTPKELSELYQRSAGMIVFERTSAATEAMLCGCPVIFSSAYGLERSSIYYDGYDGYAIAWDFDLDAFNKAKILVASFAQIYDEQQVLDDQILKDVFNNIVSHFQLRPSQILETTPAFALANAEKQIQNGHLNEAVLSYRQLIADHPSSIEAYFRMGNALVSVGLLKQGLDTLVQGESYLAKLPNHECLNGVRVLYYEKLSVASHAIGNLALSNQYVEECKKYKAVRSE